MKNLLRKVLYFSVLLCVTFVILDQLAMNYGANISLMKFIIQNHEIASTDAQNILIAGGLGTVGKVLCANLIQAGYNVIVLDVSNNYHELFNELKYQAVKSDRLKIFNGDIRNYSVLHAIQKTYAALNGIIHLAAVSREYWCEEYPVDCFKINVDGTQLFLETVKSLFTVNNNKPWLLYVSS